MLCKAIKLQPDFSDAHSNMGIAKRLLNRYKDAIEDYDKVIELQSDNVCTHYNKGIANRDLIGMLTHIRLLESERYKSQILQMHTTIENLLNSYSADTKR